MSRIQVDSPELDPRWLHTAVTFSHSSQVVEVVMIGGCPKIPLKVGKDGIDDCLLPISDTATMRFGK